MVEPEGRFDLELTFADAEVRPGLINAHDHLHRNHYGRLGGRRYANAYEWAGDIQARFADHIAQRRGDRRRALLTGAWKNLFCGVTTVVHHDRWEADFDDGFPLTVARIPSADSLGMTPSLDGLGDDQPYCLHLAEGVDETAAGEVRKLAERGLLTDALIAVHGVGIDADGAERFSRSGAALAWCPTSNEFLFGRTARGDLLDEVDVLLGSDSRLTGAGDLLDEVRRARELRLVDDARLEDAVAATAARRLGLAEPSLEPGARADLIVLATPLLEARADDVLLVIAGGELRVAHPELADALNRMAPHGEQMTVGGVTRWISNTGRSLQ